MKKLFTLLLTLILCLTSSLAFACYTPDENKVNVKYYANASDIPPMLLGGKETIGLVPEPAASALERNYNGTLYRLDLQELYDSQTKAYPQAVLMVKQSVIGAHPNLALTLQNKITESVAWAKENTATAVTAIGNHGATTLKAPALTQTAIDGCKIYWQSATEAKQQVKDYVNGIIEIDSTKATAVNDDFFFANQTGENQKQSYTFIAPDGAPAIAISKLLNDNDTLATEKTINYSVVLAELIQSGLASGSADFVLAPVNMASKLYKTNNPNDPYLMVAVITHGNFYIMSTEEITINDLAGKQIAVPMPNAVPDWSFKMALNKHGLTCVTVE